MPYAELHALSNFSFQRGASHAGELIGRAAALGYSAIAITDECSFAGIVRAYQAVQHAENIDRIRLIVGAEFRCADGLKLVMLAPTRQAYQQISALISRARSTVRKGGYRLTREDAAELCGNAFVLWIPEAEPSPADARWVRTHFRNAWIAVELHLQAGERTQLASLIALGTMAGLPCVAAGDVHYHIPQRRALQDVMTALRLKRPVSQCGQQLFANAERHLRELGQLANLYPPELLAESVAIAERCTFSMAEIRYDYPHELVPEGLTPTRHLRNLTEDGIRRRWPQGAPGKVLEQIDKELELIAELQYEAFFLTVHDIVAFANENGILCQGRGSAANSAVCYALGVTSVDPAQQNLLFGRFLSRERAEPPDIDVDFEHERREEIIQHIYEKYGRERAAIAATVICYRSRSALRDVGRALGVAPEDIDRLAKSLAWWDDPDKLEGRLRALGFDLRERQLQLWMQLTRELSGFPRHLSQHVGGFVISDRPLSELVPIEKAAMADRTIIQWDKDDLEALGLLKVDVLALGMLTAIRKSFKLIRDFYPGSPR